MQGFLFISLVQLWSISLSCYSAVQPCWCSGWGTSHWDFSQWPSKVGHSLLECFDLMLKTVCNQNFGVNLLIICKIIWLYAWQCKSKYALCSTSKGKYQHFLTLDLVISHTWQQSTKYCVMQALKYCLLSCFHSNRDIWIVQQSVSDFYLFIYFYQNELMEWSWVKKRNAISVQKKKLSQYFKPYGD